MIAIPFAWHAVPPKSSETWWTNVVMFRSKAQGDIPLAGNQRPNFLKNVMQRWPLRSSILMGVLPMPFTGQEALMLTIKPSRDPSDSC